ncbi:diaminopropionate ammonia-lyase [Ferrovibrio sp.]|uniref:diaminopropionate ammonia-lyase n=1 Tax=Ferrovibrio sp. TaxID=1917215 RepID=UPI001B643EAD|nr:diaminopropionate ammonia-lyase [Ferrovibrio sp.]MBP7063847.1 diaminopropionate ammonia-lyase [Ferrovibrio sp.]
MNIQYLVNPRRQAGAYPATLAPIQSHAALARARAEIAAWPGFAATPLHNLAGLAAEHGLANIRYKDEGGRFGLGSFKALGGAYAVLRLLQRQTGLSSAELLSGRHRHGLAGITVTCATDGNHGRSVAWGAQLFGCACVIYVHATVSQGRCDAIAAYGARVQRCEGNYDDSVRQAQQDAEARGWFVVSDTSYPGYRDVPRDVMQGYGVMIAEAFDHLAPAEYPTHVFVQGGVGGLAAAMLAYLWERFGAARPCFVVVEPDRAACLYESARAGHPVVVGGALDTVMAGLACGEVSELAWEILDPGADGFMTIPDEAALEMMRRLAQDGVVAGESAVAGLAGALAARAAGLFGLDAGSRLLVFGSEGATDPALYRQIVGRSHLEVTA